MQSIAEDRSSKAAKWRNLEHYLRQRNLECLVSKAAFDPSFHRQFRLLHPCQKEHRQQSTTSSSTPSTMSRQLISSEKFPPKPHNCRSIPAKASNCHTAGEHHRLTVR